MNKNIIISNEKITAEISPLGAEIKSLIFNGAEKIWQADPDFWGRSGPVLFPICGGLKDGTYTYNGGKYNLEKHGYAKNSFFEIETAKADCAVLVLRSDEKSFKNYPFKYELRAAFELCGNALKITYKIKNLSEYDMYFSIGSHEGFSTPGGIQDYYIEFEKDEDLFHTILDNALLTYGKAKISKGKIDLDYSYFAKDALVFQNPQSENVSLKNKKSGECVKVTFGCVDALLFWTVPEAKYICIEPWCGMPDFVDADGDITKKAGIIKLSPSDTCDRSHIIEFNG